MSGQEKVHALVTGGAGFIGSNLVDALLKRGLKVAAIDNLSTGRQENLSKAQSIFSDSFIFYQADITTPSAGEVIKDFRPDIIFHLAAQMNVRKSVAEPAFDAHTNVVGTVNLLQSALEAKTKRFVFSSTGGAIYGEQLEFPAKESHRTQAECPYGVAKRASELYLEYFARTSEMAAVSLRFANVYGPRQNPRGEAGVVAIFIERLLSEQVLTVFGDGLQTRDFIYVDDVVNANLKMLDANNYGALEVYNVGTSIESTVLDLIKGLEPVWNKHRCQSITNDTGISVQHAAALPGEQRRSSIDPHKLKQAFSWKPEVSLMDGLERTFLWFLENESR